MLADRANRMRLDPLDGAILALLRDDARLSFRDLAQRVGSTTPTVAARVRAMEDIGLLQGYHARIDAQAMGGTAYIVILATRPDGAAQAAQHVAAVAGAEAAHLLPGGRIVAHFRIQSPATLHDLHEALAGLPGLVGYDAFEVLRTHAAPGSPDLPTTVDVPCHQCGGPIHGNPVKARLGGRAHVFCCRQCASAFAARYEATHAGAQRAGNGP